MNTRDLITRLTHLAALGDAAALSRLVRERARFGLPALDHGRRISKRASRAQPTPDQVYAFAAALCFGIFGEPPDRGGIQYLPNLFDGFGGAYIGQRAEPLLVWYDGECWCWHFYGWGNACSSDADPIWRTPCDASQNWRDPCDDWALSARLASGLICTPATSECATAAPPLLRWLL